MVYSLLVLSCKWRAHTHTHTHTHTLTPQLPAPTHLFVCWLSGGRLLGKAGKGLVKVILTVPIDNQPNNKVHVFAKQQSTGSTHFVLRLTLRPDLFSQE